MSLILTWVTSVLVLGYDFTYAASEHLREEAMITDYAAIYPQMYKVAHERSMSAIRKPLEVMPGSRPVECKPAKE
jgi:hypothetical protein